MVVAGWAASSYSVLRDLGVICVLAQNQAACVSAILQL